MMTAIECRHKILQLREKNKRYEEILAKASPATSFRAIAETKALIARHNLEISILTALLPTLE